MELLKTIKQNEGTVRIVSTLVLAAIAIRSFATGKRVRGLLAAGGAVAIGSTASTLEPTPVEVEPEVESTTERGQLQCSICTEPIVAGQSRRPNEDDETVHEACLGHIA
jgi:hypothetical protein